MSDRARSRKPRPKGRARLRIWGIVNLAVLLAFTGWVLRNAEQTKVRDDASATVVSTATAQAGGGASASASAWASASAGTTAAKTTASVPTKAQILAETSISSTSAKYFGVSATKVPWAPSALQAIAKNAGVSPDMAEYYVNWTQSFDPGTVRDAYAQGTIPVLTWESFAGLKGSTWNTLSQPAYSLSKIIDGDYDSYITTFAQGVKAVALPVVIRLDHEMNGDWFPWSEDRNGNSSGQYVEAWRHIWTLFQKAGVTNVIWDWAPNVIRGATITDLEELYPGDQYVDWVGLSAYDDTETTASALLYPSLEEIRGFTRKPMLITETGAEPGAQKVAFTESFLSWLPKQADVIGFIWNEISAAQGSGTDWGFDADSATLAAFQRGIKNVTLVKVPAV